MHRGRLSLAAASLALLLNACAARSDPQFIAAAKQASIYINPMGGEELQATVEKIAGPSARELMALRQATEFKGAEKTGP